MGNNRAFTILESIIIATYNKGVLDKELLSSFLEACRDTDIDTGGMIGTLSNTGRDAIEIIVEVFEAPISEKPDLPHDRKLWTEDHYSAYEEYQDKLSDRFYKITKQFGW